MSKTSRRDFLKTSTMLTGGAMLSSMPLSQAANSLVDDTIKVALIGCGGRGTGAALQALMTKQNVRLETCRRGYPHHASRIQTGTFQ